MIFNAFPCGLTLLVASVEVLNCSFGLEYWSDMLMGLVGLVIKDCVA